MGNQIIKGIRDTYSSHGKSAIDEYFSQELNNGILYAIQRYTYTVKKRWYFAFKLRGWKLVLLYDRLLWVNHTVFRLCNKVFFLKKMSFGPKWNALIDK